MAGHCPFSNLSRFKLLKAGVLKHTENVRDQEKSRCNIISKLTGTDWRAPASILRKSAIALVNLSHNIGCHRGGDVLMSSMLTRSLTSRCVQSLAPEYQPTSTGYLCSATSSAHIFALIVLPCRSTRRLSSSQIMLPSIFVDI